MHSATVATPVELMTRDDDTVRGYCAAGVRRGSRSEDIFHIGRGRRF